MFWKREQKCITVLNKWGGPALKSARQVSQGVKVCKFLERLERDSGELR